MDTKELFGILPVDFNTRVLELVDTIGMDGSFYFNIGRYLPEFNDDDDELMEDLCDMIIAKWPELEF